MHKKHVSILKFEKQLKYFTFEKQFVTIKLLVCALSINKRDIHFMCKLNVTPNIVLLFSTLYCYNTFHCIDTHVFHMYISIRTLLSQ